MTWIPATLVSWAIPSQKSSCTGSSKAHTGPVWSHNTHTHKHIASSAMDRDLQFIWVTQKATYISISEFPSSHRLLFCMYDACFSMNTKLLVPNIQHAVGGSPSRSLTILVNSVHGRSRSSRFSWVSSATRLAEVQESPLPTSKEVLTSSSYATKCKRHRSFGKLPKFIWLIWARFD